MNNYYLACLIALMSVGSSLSLAASLFGDHTCKQWAVLDYATKKSWTNAFLAPLSLTYQGIQKTSKDHYNDNPLSYENAIDNINNYCLLHVEEEATAGALHYLETLSEK